MKRSDVIVKLIDIESIIQDPTVSYFQKSAAMVMIFETMGFLPPAKGGMYLMKNEKAVEALTTLLDAHSWEDEESDS